MYTQKISISLPEQQFNFIREYQAQYHCKSRSDVVQVALRLLQEEQLRQQYYEANKEIDHAFDVTIGDGLESDETW